jgi:uncharacterized DUF497 family protein
MFEAYNMIIQKILKEHEDDICSAWRCHFKGRFLHLTFTIRTSKIRVISARDMHRKERTIYEQEA